jgi:hypothetical protein
MKHLRQYLCSVSKSQAPEKTTCPAAACYRITVGHWPSMFWVTQVARYHPHDWGYFEHGSSLLKLDRYVYKAHLQVVSLAV